VLAMDFLPSSLLLVPRSAIGTAQRNYVRGIDESGEDYLYPQAWFVPLQLPASVGSALLESLFGEVAA
jgi:hypothetical protein